jgi:hypothetical protein
MAVWKLQRMARVSSLTGEPFPPDTEVVTALFGEDEEPDGREDAVRGAAFVRRDYLASEATDALLAGAYCVWRTRTPPERPQEARRLDLDMAQDFLRRLLAEGDPERAAVCLTLALLLARKRRIVVLAQEPDRLRARWPRETEEFDVPAPAVGEADAERLQQELMRLFDVE